MFVLLTTLLLLPAPRDMPPIEVGERFTCTSFGYTFETYTDKCVVTAVFQGRNGEWWATLKADSGDVFDKTVFDLLNTPWCWSRERGR